MGKFDITPEDVAFGTLLKPGWYPGTVTKVEDRPAKTDGSNVTHVNIRIDSALTHSDEPVSGVPVKATFSEKAPGTAVNFLRACGENIGKDGKKGAEISDEKHRGVQVKVRVNNDVYEGRNVNKVVDFMPLG